MKILKFLVIIGSVFIFGQIPSAQSNLEDINSYESILREILITIKVHVPAGASEDALKYGYKYIKTSNNYCKKRFFTKTKNRRKINVCEHWLQDAVIGLNNKLGKIDSYTRVHLNISNFPIVTNDTNVKVGVNRGIIYVQYKEISKNYLLDSIILRNKLNLAKSQSVETPKLIILDLRGNVGGYVYQAVEVTDIFLAKGRVATLNYYASSGTNIYWDAKPQPWSNHWLEQIPIAIITDRMTASAAEIIVAALLDNDRAKIHIGETTFGKGVFQTTFKGYLYELRVTEGIAKRLKGGSFNKIGIKPQQDCDQSIRPFSALSYACSFMDGRFRLTASN